MVKLSHIIVKSVACCTKTGTVMVMPIHGQICKVLANFHNIYFCGQFPHNSYIMVTPVIHIHAYIVTMKP